MSKQRELIDRIRREEYGIGVNLQGEAKTVVDNMVRKYRSLLSTVAEDLNSKESHFILELIQNADDNSYDPSVDPSLSFSLEGNRLVVQNNEVGFEEKNVRALCSAGESSKKSEKRKGYIGEKGIGFKSIFKVTDSPEVHSNGFHFRFDRSNPEDLLGYVVPHWHETDIQLDEQTTLVIPAKSGHQFASSTLADVSDSLLLFLQKLRKLDVRTSDGQYHYQRKDQASITTLVTTKAGEAPIREDFLRKTFKVDMSDIHEPKRDGIKEAEIVLAFPIDESGKAAPISGCDTYAFLPIRDFGFNFYIQADFVLASSREAIHEELKWNIRLRDAISDAFVEAIGDFKKRTELTQTYLKYFPTKEEVHDPFFSSVVDQLIEKLKAVECIPVAGGGWKKPAQVLITSEKIRELFPIEDAVWIFGTYYLQDGFILPSQLKKSLEFKDLMITDVASVFSKHSDWLKRKSTDWKAQFYAYLSLEGLRKSFVKLLEKLPCIPLENGKLVVPSESSVFFPLSAGKKYGFEHELSILNPELLKQAIKISKDVQLLFSELGVKQDNSFDLVQSHILKLHKVDEWLDSDNDALIGHVRYIKDKFDQYIEGAIANNQQRTVAISALRDGLYIGTKNKKITDELWTFNRTSELYFGKEFQPEFDLESLLERKVSPELFIAPVYINSLGSGASKELQDKEIAGWRDFFTRLGANTSPRVVKEPSGNIVCSKELDILLNSEDPPSIRRVTLEVLDRNWVNYSSHTTYQLKIGRTWNSYQTGLVTKLKSVIAPTRKKVRVSLSEAYKDNADTRAVLGDSVVFVDAELHNHAFLDACGITYKVDAAACLKRLRQVKEDNVRSLDQIRKIYRCLDTLWDRERASIEVTFTQERLIRVGIGESTKWVLPKETCWKEAGNRFLDQLYPSLSGSYRDFHGFFVNKLKAPELLSIRNWVDALKSFDKVDEDERPVLALFIYRRLSQAIDSHYRSGGHSLNPDWVDDLDTYSLLLNRRGEMVDKSEHFYADDRPEISKLFDNEGDISFLNAPANQLPSVKSLLNELKIQQISDVVEVQVSDDIDGVINNRLTAKLREMLVPIAKIVYNQNHAAFEDGIKTGLFKELRKTDVLEVSSLVLTVTLGGWSREMSGVSAARKNEILLDEKTRSKHDYVAIEVEKILLKQRKGVSAHIGRILMAESTEDANDYLEVQKILDLPDDKMERLLLSINCEVEPVLEPSGEETDWIEANEDGDFSPSDDTIDAKDSTIETDTLHGGEYSTLRNEHEKTHKTNVAQAPTSDISSHTVTAHFGSDSNNQVSYPSITSATNLSPASTVSTQIKHSDTEKPDKSPDTIRPKSKSVTRSGRLLSYAEPKNMNGEENEIQENSDLVEHKKSVERAAVKFFIEKVSSKWKHLHEMPPNNPGYDFSAETFDGKPEYIEVKGQSGAWTEEGVALTPTELRSAALYGEHYWLCVVEFALDDARRRLWLVPNLFGKTNQFRFDRGWQDVAEKNAVSPLRPELGLFVTIPDLGKVKIVEVLGNGLLVKLKVELEDKSIDTKMFSPATMTLSED